MRGEVPVGYGNHSLRGPILVPFFVFHVQQNPEATRTVQLGSLCIGEAVAHATSAGLCSVAKEPGIACVGRWIGSEGDGLSRRKDRRGHHKRRNWIMNGSEARQLRPAGNHQRQIGVRHRASLAVFHIVKRHVGHVASDRGFAQRRLIESPYIAEGDALQTGVLLLQLHQGIPVIDEEILNGKARVDAFGVLRAPKAEETEALATGADAGMKNIGVAQSKAF